MRECQRRAAAARVGVRSSPWLRLVVAGVRSVGYGGPGGRLAEMGDESADEKRGGRATASGKQQRQSLHQTRRRHAAAVAASGQSGVRRRLRHVRLRCGGLCGRAGVVGGGCGV